MCGRTPIEAIAVPLVARHTTANRAGADRFSGATAALFPRLWASRAEGLCACYMLSSFSMMCAVVIYRYYHGTTSSAVVSRGTPRGFYRCFIPWYCLEGAYRPSGWYVTYPGGAIAFCLSFFLNLYHQGWFPVVD